MIIIEANKCSHPTGWAVLLIPIPIHYKCVLAVFGHSCISIVHQFLVTFRLIT